jgi:hypothetical protein
LKFRLSLEIKELKDNAGYSVRYERENGYFSIKGGEKVEEPSKPIIPTLGVVETIAVIPGTYVVIRLRKRKR